ncbi:hypothetical protein Bca52824_087316 [Brassica carinata]|uniref:Uncharacterized protein n=1 Tax=Brassica carinata TaxID=52824 RepID=A0A8X7PBY4_BRACI|nr:hypothetical protein Bca52824_087316 [Brassica carinata]
MSSGDEETELNFDFHGVLPCVRALSSRDEMESRLALRITATNQLRTEDLVVTVYYGHMTEILVRRACFPDDFTRLTSIMWINEIVLKHAYYKDQTCMSQATDSAMTTLSIRISGFKEVHGLGFIGPKIRKKRLNGFKSVIRLLLVNPYDTGSSHALNRKWPRVIASNARKIGFRLGFLSLGGDFSCDATAGDFLDLIDVGLSPRRSQMDPAEERRETKRQKEFINMQGYVADSEYGIPTRCPCGGRIIVEVRGKDDYDTLPGKRFFTCKNYVADGFHYRQPWVIGVQEHIECLTKRVEEVEMVIKWVLEVNNQIERLEAEVKALNREVDNLTDRFITSRRSRVAGGGCVWT